MLFDQPTIKRNVIAIDAEYLKQTTHFVGDDEESHHKATYDSDSNHSNPGSDSEDVQESLPSFKNLTSRLFAPSMFSSKPAVGVKRTLPAPSTSQKKSKEDPDFEIAEMLLLLGNSDNRPSSPPMTPSSPPTSPMQSGSDDDQDENSEIDDEEILEFNSEEEDTWEGDALLEEEEDDDWQVANPPTKVSRRKAPSGTACDKHKKWKKRCPADCPGRKRSHSSRSHAHATPSKKTSSTSSSSSSSSASTTRASRSNSFSQYKGRFTPPVLSESIYEESMIPSRRSARYDPSPNFESENYESISSKRRYLIGACEKHRAQHTRCPPECPHRKH